MTSENILPPEITAAIEKYSPFFREIRRRLISSIAILVLSVISGFFFYEDIIGFLVRNLSLKGVNVVFTSPFQFINLAISCGVAVGMVAIVPLAIYQILAFLRPALRRKEFKTLSRFIPFSLFLFAVGFIFGVVIMKWQIQIFLERSMALQIGNILDITSLLSTILYTSVLMGLGFQFPIVLLLLMRFGILKPQQLSAIRSWVYLGSFVFAILLPPDSIIADIVLSLPLIILYEITLLMHHFARKPQHKISEALAD